MNSPTGAIQIRKEPNGKWFADVVWSDGKIWCSYFSNFKTKKAIVGATEDRLKNHDIITTYFFS